MRNGRWIVFRTLMLPGILITAIESSLNKLLTVRYMISYSFLCIPAAAAVMEDWDAVVSGLESAADE